MSTLEKNSSCGVYLIKTLFSELISKQVKKAIEFYESNFYDTRNYLKGVAMKSEISLNSKETSTNSISSITLNFGVLNNYFIFATVDNYIFCGPYLKETGSEFRIPSFLKETIQLVSFIL